MNQPKEQNQIISPETIATPSQETNERKPPRQRIRKPALASCVTFDKAEHDQIANDSRDSGMTIPALLKNAYFPNRRVRVLMNKDEQDRWLVELKRIGNNVNQIARQMNSGIRAGWYEEFKVVTTALLHIQQMVLGIYGRR